MMVYEVHLAVNKLSGLQVLPGGLFQQKIVLTQLKWKAIQLSKYRSLVGKVVADLQESQPILVHRMGRGTSGILLCAKSKLQNHSLW
jgi:23S rRNA-/tRNA-specific pseudouridylate synthase